jgi:hypothetical protein
MQRTMKNLILNSITFYRDEILDFTKALIAVQTENPPSKSYRACIEVIENKQKQLKAKPKIYSYSTEQQVRKPYIDTEDQTKGLGKCKKPKEGIFLDRRDCFC